MPHPHPNPDLGTLILHPVCITFQGTYMYILLIPIDIEIRVNKVLTVFIPIDALCGYKAHGITPPKEYGL